LYQLDPEGLGQLRSWIDQFWTESLLALKAEVERGD
jgi:hypothetical protein